MCVCACLLSDVVIFKKTHFTVSGSLGLNSILYHLAVASLEQNASAPEILRSDFFFFFSCARDKNGGLFVVCLKEKKGIIFSPRINEAASVCLLSLR